MLAQSCMFERNQFGSLRVLGKLGTMDFPVDFELSYSSITSFLRPDRLFSGVITATARLWFTIWRIICYVIPAGARIRFGANQIDSGGLTATAYLITYFAALSLAADWEFTLYLAVCQYKSTTYCG